MTKIICFSSCLFMFQWQFSFFCFFKHKCFSVYVSFDSSGFVFNDTFYFFIWNQLKKPNWNITKWNYTKPCIKIKKTYSENIICIFWWQKYKTKNNFVQMSQSVLQVCSWLNLKVHVWTLRWNFSLLPEKLWSQTDKSELVGADETPRSLCVCDGSQRHKHICFLQTYQSHCSSLSLYLSPEAQTQSSLEKIQIRSVESSPLKHPFFKVSSLNWSGQPHTWHSRRLPHVSQLLNKSSMGRLYMSKCI